MKHFHTPSFLLLLLSLIAATTLHSCKKEMIFPISSGRPYEVLVVLDSTLWMGPAGRALFDVLDTDVPGLPQSERSFRISQVEEKHFNNALIIFRNIIRVNIDPTQFTQARMKYARNKYAMEQVVLTINTPSEAELEKFCREYRQQIVDFITKTEMNRLIRELHKEYSKATMDLAQQLFQCQIYAPKELKSWKKGDAFVWTSNNASSGLESIVIYSYPYEGPSTFNKQYMLRKRDSVMRCNLPGEKPGMYMATDTLCTTVKPTVVHDEFAMELRGLWYMENDCMGGPFVSLSRVDTEAGQVVVAEGFVYAPEKMKRGLIRRLEASLHTLRLPHEQEAFYEIEGGVEEERTDSTARRKQ